MLVFAASHVFRVRKPAAAGPRRPRALVSSADAQYITRSEATTMSAGDPRSWMWAEACMMIERAERLHRQFFQPSLSDLPSASWEPPVDIFETEREIWIIAALPGVEPQDLKVTLDGGELRIAGSRRQPAAVRGAAFLRLEIPYGRFERRIHLSSARLELARSELASGCLLLSLTKRL
jgi:HSP20 family molecular chaperone IbpA